MTRMKAVLYGVGLLAAIGAGFGGRALAWRAIAPARPATIAMSPKGGALMICGGGKVPDEVRQRFLDLAGGPRARIVVIPTAHAAADAPDADDVYLKPWRDRGAPAVTMLHTRSREKSNDPAFLAPLREATGVWISGGKQATLAAMYGETEVEKQLKAVLDRGGVVGGTSAGAAVMTSVMIQSGRTEAIAGRGFGLLADAIVDQHFLKRKRVDRLVGLLGKHPGLVGFGVDEGTALLVRSNHLSVLGDSYVVACLPSQDKTAPPKLEFLRKGDEADLASLKGPEPHIISALDLDALSSDE